MSGAAAAGESDAIEAEAAAGDFEGAELAAFFAGLVGGGGEVVGRCHVWHGCVSGGGEIQVFCCRGGDEFHERSTNWGVRSPPQIALSASIGIDLRLHFLIAL